MSPPLSPPLTLEWRPFRFALPRALVTAQGALEERAGWLLRLQASDGRLGWGEAAPLELGVGLRGGAPGACADTLEACRATIAELGPSLRRQQLEEALPTLPGSLAFGIGAALAELEGWAGEAARGGLAKLGGLVGEAAGLEGLAGEVGGGGLAAGWLAESWLPAPPSAWLLPAGASVLPALEEALASNAQTLKWKVAAGDDALERQLLEVVLERLPEGARLRLDANGGWDRAAAAAWAERLAGEPRLEWLEQPLADDDLEGLEALVARLPVALDESLRRHPWLRQRWSGWQVRRPALEGDPRPLLAALAAGRAGWMVSTAFETGVGRRLVEHAAALQWRGPTPTAPGLAPQWRPTGPLFEADPAVAWASLEAEGP
ncbi:o-succinylbenzoate synthase [Vulcanococcus limneticus]|uniref:o-succinylbenzoate synthase n=1 Tax=Vulcanococcus limneticus TaxID=2170428 RepID=UPI00398BD30E